MSLSVNLLIGMIVAVWALWLSRVLWRARLKVPKPLKLLVGGVILMTLPVLWTPENFISAALPRLFALWGMVLLTGLLLQSPASNKYRSLIYRVIAIAGLLQVGLSIWQILLPESAHLWLGYSFAKADGRPLGSFMQVNLLGSFLSTATLVAVWQSTVARTRHGKFTAWGAALVLAAGVVITQSRTGELGLGIGMLVFCLAGCGRRFIASCLLISILALFLGQTILSLRQTNLSATTVVSEVASAPRGDTRPQNTEERLAWNHQHSHREREVMVKGALMMISSQPIAGYGLGTFETQFPRTLFINGLENPFSVSVEYPHNELLYVWSEGGILAAAGLMICLITIICTTMGKRTVMTRGALLLPILTHMMTEYPLYLSAAHCLLLIILFWLACPATCRKSDRRSTNKVFWQRASLQSITCVVCVGIMIFMVTALESARQLIIAEKGMFTTNVLTEKVSNIWAQADRRLFDTAIGDLI
ncbi:O-antigen ligase C-terminal domain-containing protein, partial [Enterobacter cloacae complex sp. P4RS]